ncbi:MAG TPA: histidine kinase [Pseudoxanthomonas sp.]|nr:histidine kinase [Pseudoxanthomonas sp.]
MTRDEQATPLDTLWQGPVMLWVILAGEGVAAVLALGSSMGGSRWVHFGLTSFIVQWVSLVTLGTLYLFRAPLARLKPTYVAYLALLVLVVASALVCAAGWWVFWDVWPMAQDGWTPMFLRFTGIALIVGMLGLAAFLNHWRARQLAVKAKQSELEALQARIRPHFLFNTLNTGAALIHQRPQDAERVLLDLADLFRAALAGPREIPLAEELALARRYLEIEHLRFGDRLRVHWQVTGDVPVLPVPTLSIQPLVENAIRHGVEPDPQGGDIWVEVTSDTSWLVVTVRNTLPARPSTTPGHQVGQSSVRARIHALTQGRGELSAGRDGEQYVAMIRLPVGAG